MTTNKKSLDNLSDETICEQFSITHDKALISELYIRYGHLVYGTCLKYLQDSEKSKDVVSGIFEKLIHKIPSTDIKVFKNWLYSVAKTECLMRIRKEKKYDQLKSNIHYLENNNNKKHTSITIDNIQIGNHLTTKTKNTEQLISEALATLKPEQKCCIDLFFFKNESYKSISQSTGYTDKQVKSHLQNGKRKIKQYLIKHS